MNRKVFVLNDGGHDYSKASEFGEVIICSHGVVPKHDMNQMFRMLNPFLEDADAKDLILVSSLSSLCSVASAIMAANHGEVHYLVYHQDKYLVKDLML